MTTRPYKFIDYCGAQTVVARIEDMQGRQHICSVADLVPVRSTPGPIIKGSTLVTTKPEKPQMIDSSSKRSGDTDDLIDAEIDTDIAD